MVESHPCLIPVRDDVTLWRYLSYEKFESLLVDKGLFFCRLDKFSDPFEGSVPTREVEFRINEAKKYASRFNLEFSLEKDDKPIADMHRRSKRTTIANCWQINNNESDAMWQLYLKDNEGVAIQTHLSNMISLMDPIDDMVFPSKVRYIDYDKDIWYDATEYPVRDYNFLTPFVHKRVEYEHENEFRFFIEVKDAEQNEEYWDSQPILNGKIIKLNVNKLVEKVLFAPTADAKVKEKLERLATENGSKFNFEDSKLIGVPRY
jgi:hypothetical protein